MKLSITKSVGKKIMFMVVCAVLLLIFMSSSYGGIDPKYVVREHPWDRCLSPRIEDNLNLNLVTVVIHQGFCFIYTFQSSWVYEDTQGSVNQKPSFSKNHDNLKKNERKPQE